MIASNPESKPKLDGSLKFIVSRCRCRTKSLALKSAATWVARCWSLPRCGSMRQRMICTSCLPPRAFASLCLWQHSDWEKQNETNWTNQEFWSCGHCVIRVLSLPFPQSSPATQPNGPTDQEHIQRLIAIRLQVRFISTSTIFLFSRTCFFKKDTKFD